ncbi:anthranilate phosphoribosyltransferase [Paractinoplanes ferrugineus]|uniref:Anthranilate phosphoribosyltransferase n=1 Tax=Paractinoplanes ferrugineus TaxID=113564 RepID=A0A919MD61_9ACTN|nr:anthranilate phosphoribosyltransferase [Actinoplanes ferrugineus]GIE11433.1 anthranilate phosphoribosyltransferase 1 [Actinoplanes ferrugineus]
MSTTGTGTISTAETAGRWSGILATLMRREDLTEADTAWVMGEVIADNATPGRLGAFLSALRTKGESSAEIKGLAQALLANTHRISVPGTIVDIVGTGGAGGMNISTMAAVVVASTGVRVVKHGGRGASSRCGSADLLERLGIPMTLSPTAVAGVAAEAGITFCFAPVYHPGLRHAASTRRELGVPTVFNVLAPLINPADPRHQLVGASYLPLAPVMADVFAERGCSSLVVRGHDGLDELTTAAPSDVWVVRNGTVEQSRVDPADFGIARTDPAALRGGDIEENAAVAREFLAGAKGPIRDAVLLNAAAALATVDLNGGSLMELLSHSLARCAEAVDSGAAAATLQRWVKLAQQAA